MKILVCPDSYKGTMTASEAALAIEAGIAAIRPEADVERLPVGDGGEGTLEAVASVLPDISWISCPSLDPLHRQLTARYAIVNGKTAFIESAAASGLTLLKSEERDIMNSDSYGTGLLIADAIRRGIRDFIICLGGTATCDGGFGAFKALREVTGIKSLLPELSFTLLSDVGNPFCGPQGTAAVFGPQKGALPQQIPILDDRLRKIAKVYSRCNGIDVTDMKYAGAAGGLAGMLMACLNAKPVSGISKVLQLLNFESKLSGVDLIITGEGHADLTTLKGKAASGILELARKHNVPVALIGGKVSDRERLLEAGFMKVKEATPPFPDPDISPSSYLARAAEELIASL